MVTLILEPKMKCMPALMIEEREKLGFSEWKATLTVKFLAKAKKPTPAVRVASAFLERRSLIIPSEPENAA